MNEGVKLSDWHTDQIEYLARCGSEEMLLRRLEQQAAELGFEYFAFGIRSPLPLTRPRVVVHNNYPADWQRRYVEQGYLSTDPSIIKALRSSLPVIWSERLFSENIQLWEEARSCRLKFGWAQSRIDGNGIQSLLTLARSDRAIPQEEVVSKAHRLLWLVSLLHQRFLDTLGGTLVPELPAKLVEREVEVLRWTAEGKTSADIAEILRISERTVNFHLNNASAKLGTCNKTAASVKAALLGLIW